jgi:murein DD-endopeptidase MepM/ murein hydrolase activator NlpD
LRSPALTVRSALAGLLNPSTPLPSLADRARSGLSRLARIRGPERLAPLAVCALLIAAALFSVLPSAGAATAPGAGYSEYGMGLAGDPEAGGPGGQGYDLAGASYPPELAIVNQVQQLAATPTPRTEFVWYVVRNGDSLRSIAARYGISIETLYFANKKSLPDPGSIKAGLRLLVPPSDGVVAVVAEGDTLVSLANHYGTTAREIIEANWLTSAGLVAGQMLVIPIDPGSLPGSTSGGRYAGGSMWWPVNGAWHISQYYWSGHHAIDIAAPYGTPVIAAAGGTVVYAGWRSYEQGGYVVWIKHTDNLYTTYNHLTSKRYVRSGQTVRAGQQVGQIGTSGITTGPHLHFEVWLSYPWSKGDNGDAVNPCLYLAQC